MVLQWKAAVNPFLPAVIQHGWQASLSEPMRIKEVKAQAVTTSKQGKQKVISDGLADISEIHLCDATLT